MQCLSRVWASHQVTTAIVWRAMTGSCQGLATDLAPVNSVSP